MNTYHEGRGTRVKYIVAKAILNEPKMLHCISRDRLIC